MGKHVVRGSEFWGGLFWLAIGAFVVWAGRDLGLGKINDPGAGFALFWLGVMMLGFSAAIMLGSFRVPGTPLTALWADTRWPKVLLVIALLVAYGWLFEAVGFLILSVVMLLALMTFVDPVKPWIAIPVALLVPLGIYQVVTKWLKIQMPAGLLAGWWG